MKHAAAPRHKLRLGRVGRLAYMGLLTCLVLAPPSLFIGRALRLAPPVPFVQPRSVRIAPGTPSRRAGRLLKDAGVISSAGWFDAALRWTGNAAVLQAGNYRFERPLSPSEAVDVLCTGSVWLINVTVPEGLTLEETAELLSSKGLGDKTAFVSAFRNPAPVKTWDARAESLEGYLFPDSYRFAEGVEPRDVAGAMVAQFQKAFLSPETWASMGGDSTALHDVVTVASLVEKETSLAEERPRISSVFKNRLRLSMPLQCDPTVIYALKRKGLYKGRLLLDDLRADSPYNTYRYRGLPPGPICSPGLASLRAALHPAPNKYLYFVADGRGGHVFSRSLDEHRRAVARYRARRARNGQRQGS